MIMAEKDIAKLYMQENAHAHRNRSYPQRLAIMGSLDPANQRRILDEKEFKTTPGRNQIWKSVPHWPASILSQVGSLSDCTDRSFPFFQEEDRREEGHEIVEQSEGNTSRTRGRIEGMQGWPGAMRHGAEPSDAQHGSKLSVRK
jgi:hypothetical protein